MNRLKKSLLLFVIVSAIIQTKHADAFWGADSRFFGIEGGYTQRIPAYLRTINNLGTSNDLAISKTINSVHGYGGTIGINYGSFWDLGKTFLIGLDINTNYIGVRFPNKDNSIDVHSFVLGLGLIFHFNVSRKIGLQIRTNTGFIVDVFIGPTNSETLSGIVWQVLPGVVIKVKKRISIPIEIGYIGNFVSASQMGGVMHGFQVLTGVRFYFRA